MTDANTTEPKFFNFVPNAYPDKPYPPQLNIKQLAPDRFELSLGGESLQFNEHIAGLLINFFKDALGPQRGVQTVNVPRDLAKTIFTSGFVAGSGDDKGSELAFIRYAKGLENGSQVPS